MTEDFSEYHCHECNQKVLVDTDPETLEVSCQVCEGSFVEKSQPDASRPRAGRRNHGPALILSLLGGPRSGADQDFPDMEQIMHEILMTGGGGNSGEAPASKGVLSHLLEHKHHVTKEECDENSDCAVCKDEFSVDQEVLKLSCEHAFCEECIVPWLKKHNTCPVCRKEHKIQSSSESLEIASNLVVPEETF